MRKMSPTRTQHPGPSRSVGAAASESPRSRRSPGPLRRNVSGATWGVVTVVACLGLLVPEVLRAQAPASETSIVSEAEGPPIHALVDASSSAMRAVVERFADDRSALYRRYDAPHSPERLERLRAFYEGWRQRLLEIDVDRLGVEGRIDYVLLDNELRYQLHELERERALYDEMMAFIPFASTITRLHEARRHDPSLNARAAADTLDALAAAIERKQRTLASTLTGGNAGARSSRIVAFRSVHAIDDLRETLEEWHAFYDAYDPLFTWWTRRPYEAVDRALDAYTTFLRREIVGIRDNGEVPIVGDPIGAEAMKADLEHEMIPYSPEELIAIAEDEFAWCQKEMREAARELGYGDDWRAALEEVKNLHVEPGAQPRLIHDLAQEAVTFLEERDLVTIPPLAKEIWRMDMMSPERQKVNPFFLGGEVIRVSFPTDGMAHEDKLMSMRGNNIHFARATVHHELIPGHHLQGFMTRRYNPHRRLFSTPFWGEGWALYWEMMLWDLGFPQSPEDRIGMLFWRSHRAARIIFSLRFHLGTMTPQEAIDFLVNRVGHERANARAEVRRSFNGSYSPLYQAAYMVGGLQLRALYEALVESGQMTPRAFHDAVLQGGRMPIEMVRARLQGRLISRDYTAAWRFAGDPIPAEGEEER